MLINKPVFPSLDLGNIKKLVNNLIRSFLGGISINDLWVLEISCILASPPNFMARTHLMLQKLTLLLLICEGLGSLTIYYY